MAKTTSPFIFALALMFLSACATSSPLKLSDSNQSSTDNNSAGCGVMQQGYDRFITVKTKLLNQDRTYHLRIPKTYNPNRAYPIIFRWHDSGGDGLSGGLGIENYANSDAIVIAADGLDNYWRIDADSIDLHLFDYILETVSAQYCIDNKRVFSVGFSIGGYFSNLLACQRGDVLRASAAIASGPAGNNCIGKVATWLLHDSNDQAIPIAKGNAARDRALAINGCSTSVVDDGDGCLRYEGCDIAPVVWCESKGFGHNIRGDYAPAQIWKFFQSLN